MDNANLISKDIDLFYSGTSEEKRLTIRAGALWNLKETKELISRYLNKKRFRYNRCRRWSRYLCGMAGGTSDIMSTLSTPLPNTFNRRNKRAFKAYRSRSDAVIGEARHLPFRG